jgi:hypothetical protein
MTTTFAILESSSPHGTLNVIEKYTVAVSL